MKVAGILKMQGYISSEKVTCSCFNLVSQPGEPQSHDHLNRFLTFYIYKICQDENIPELVEEEPDQTQTLPNGVWEEREKLEKQWCHWLFERLRCTSAGKQRMWLKSRRPECVHVRHTHTWGFHPQTKACFWSHSQRPPGAGWTTFRSSQSSALLSSSWCTVAQRPTGHLGGRRDVSDVPHIPDSHGHTKLQKVQFAWISWKWKCWVKLYLWWKSPHAAITQVPVRIRHAEFVLQLEEHVGLFHPSHTPGPGNTHTHSRIPVPHCCLWWGLSWSPLLLQPVCLLSFLDLALGTCSHSGCLLLFVIWLDFLLLCCLYLFNSASCSRVSALLFWIHVFDFGQHIYRHQLSMQLHMGSNWSSLELCILYTYIFHYLEMVLAMQVYLVKD